TLRQGLQRERTLGQKRGLRHTRVPHGLLQIVCVAQERERSGRHVRKGILPESIVHIDQVRPCLTAQRILTLEVKELRKRLLELASLLQASDELGPKLGGSRVFG